MANRHRADKRDYRREDATPDEQEPWIEELAVKEPTANDAAILNEELESRLRALSSSELRKFALQKLEGLSNQEIAEEHGCTVRNIERKVHNIFDRSGSQFSNKRRIYNDLFPKAGRNQDSQSS